MGKKIYAIVDEGAVLNVGHSKEILQDALDTYAEGSVVEMRVISEATAVLIPDLLDEGLKNTAAYRQVIRDLELT